MRKIAMFAGALSAALFASTASAESGMVEVKLTIDRADTTEVTYQKVLEKAARICLKDTHCEAALVEALVDQINDPALTQLHVENTGQFEVFQVASSDQG